MEKDLSRLVDEAADALAREIEAEAGQQAARILAEAQEDARRIQEKELAAAEAWVQAHRARRLSQVKAQLLQEKLDLKHAMVQKALEMLAERLETVRSDPGAYRKTMALLIEQAAQAMDEPVVEVNPQDLDMVRELARELGIRVKEVRPNPDVSAGAILRDQRRGFAVHNTLEQRAERARAVLLGRFREVFGI